MSLIIKNKIGNILAGTPTISDKYNVITAVVGDKMVKAGQFVDYSDTFTDNGTIKLKPVSSNSKFIGVVMHQNIHLEEKSKEPQEFEPGEVVGICISGFVTALAEKEKTITNPVKISETTGYLTDTTGVDVTNIVFTGYKNDMKDYKIVEVEIK